MTDKSYIITCSLPDGKLAEQVINAIKNEGIDVQDISVEISEKDFSGHDISSKQAYNVPLYFGAEQGTQQSAPPGDVSFPAASLIMGTAFRSSHNRVSNEVFFSMPVSEYTCGKVSLILRKHHGRDIRLTKQ